jgi:hypothetical protein
VQLRVYLLEVVRSEKDESPDHAGLVGAASELPAKLRDLRRRGMLTTARRINLAAADGHTALATLGENRAFTTGAAVTGGGFSQRSISYRDLGTTVQATPLVGPDGVVSLRLQVTDSRPAAGLPAPAGDGGPSAAEFTNLRVESSLRVRAGEVALVHETTTQTVTGQAESIILVTATVEDATPKK